MSVLSATYMGQPLVAVPTETPRRRRTDHILDAIRKELELRRATMNADEAIRSVTVVVKMKKGSPFPRAVIMTVETETEL